MEEMVFRGMIPDCDGKPKRGQSWKCLGVRIPADIIPDAGGNVSPNMGGMSVSPDDFLNVPNYRRPKAMGHGSTGPDHLRMYAIGKGRVSIGSLQLRPDPSCVKKHAFVEPGRVMPLAQYEEALGSTRDDWRRIWPTN